MFPRAFLFLFAAQLRLVCLTQPQPSQQGPYGSANTTRTSPNSNYSNLNPPAPPSNTDISRSGASQQFSQYDSSASVHVPSQQGYSTSDAVPLYQTQTHARQNNPLQQSRSFTQASGSDDTASVMSVQNNQPVSVAKPSRSNRQSMHNGIAGTSPGSQQQQQQQQQTQQNMSQQYSIPPPPMPTQYNTEREQSRGNAGRATPQPSAEDMDNEEVGQLIKDHRELSMSFFGSAIVLPCSDETRRRKIHQGQEVLL